MSKKEIKAFEILCANIREQVKGMTANKGWLRSLQDHSDPSVAEANRGILKHLIAMADRDTTDSKAKDAVEGLGEILGLYESLHADCALDSKNSFPRVVAECLMTGFSLALMSGGKEKHEKRDIQTMVVKFSTLLGSDQFRECLSLARGGDKISAGVRGYVLGMAKAMADAQQHKTLVQ